MVSLPGRLRRARRRSCARCQHPQRSSSASRKPPAQRPPNAAGRSRRAAARRPRSAGSFAGLLPAHAAARPAPGTCWPGAGRLRAVPRVRHLRRLERRARRPRPHGRARLDRRAGAHLRAAGPGGGGRRAAARPRARTRAPLRSGALCLFAAITLALAAGTLGSARAPAPPPRPGRSAHLQSHGGVVGEALFRPRQPARAGRRRGHPRRVPGDRRDDAADGILARDPAARRPAAAWLGTIVAAARPLGDAARRGADEGTAHRARSPTTTSRPPPSPRTQRAILRADPVRGPPREAARAAEDAPADGGASCGWPRRRARARRRGRGGGRGHLRRDLHARVRRGGGADAAGPLARLGHRGPRLRLGAARRRARS